MRTLLKSGRIYDGAGAEPRVGDLLIDGERIARIAPEIDEAADAVYDLRGKSVAPGFMTCIRTTTGLPFTKIRSRISSRLFGRG